jgi:hypothetical protein
MKAQLEEIKDLLLAMINRKGDYLTGENITEKAAKAVQLEIDTLLDCLLLIQTENEYQQKQMMVRHHTILNLMEKINCLEAIAIIHGIDDLNLWLAKGERYLTGLAVEMYFNQETDYSLQNGRLIEKTTPARQIQIPAALCQTLKQN